MLGWAPDDSVFVYALPPETDKKSGTDVLYICDGKTGETMGKVQCPGNLAGLAWLSPQTFAYILPNHEVVTVIVHEKTAAGRWMETHNYGQVDRTKGSPQNFLATSTNSVAWRSGVDIREFDMSSAVVTTLWRGDTNKLADFTYSTESGEFLLNCTDDKGQYLIRFNSSTKSSFDGGRISDPLHPVRSVMWQKGPAYAYLANDRGTNTFFVKSDGHAEIVPLAWPGGIRTYAFRNGTLYVAGSVGSEPAGIYAYDAPNPDLVRIVSSLRQPLRHAQLVAPVDGVFTNESGNLASYHVWRPVNFSPHKKYPVILCQTPYIWTPFPQIAANAGYYYAWVDRPSWWEGIDRWCADVKGLYEIMAKNPNADTGRVFLYGASAETWYCAELLSEKPCAFRGVLYFSPSVPPPLSGNQLAAMLFVVGHDEGDTVVKRWTDYQDKAAQEGICVSLDFERGANHISRSIATERDRAEHMAQFLKEN